MAAEEIERCKCVKVLKVQSPSLLAYNVFFLCVCPGHEVFILVNFILEWLMEGVSSTLHDEGNFPSKRLGVEIKPAYCSKTTD